MTPSTTLGVACANVNTFHRQFSADAEAMTSGTTNSDVVPNFRDFLANLVLRWAAEADTESRLQIWRETCYGGQAPAPTVLFIIDPILNPYMFTPGDTRLLGDRYPFLVHQTYNASSVARSSCCGSIRPIKRHRRSEHDEPTATPCPKPK